MAPEKAEGLGHRVSDGEPLNYERPGKQLNSNFYHPSRRPTTFCVGLCPCSAPDVIDVAPAWQTLGGAALCALALLGWPS